MPRGRAKGSKNKKNRIQNLNPADAAVDEIMLSKNNGKKPRKHRKARASDVDTAETLLQIYDGESAMTKADMDSLWTVIKMEDLACLTKYDTVTGRCKKANKMFRGHGVCVAKKFLKYGWLDFGCGSCRSDEIINQLNAIFTEKFGAKYRAEWRQKRKYMKKIG